MRLYHEGNSFFNKEEANVFFSLLRNGISLEITTEDKNKNKIKLICRSCPDIINPLTALIKEIFDSIKHM